MSRFQKCCLCGGSIQGYIYGNMCRDNEKYCKDCWDKLPDKDKKLIDWHFSQDML